MRPINVWRNLLTSLRILVVWFIVNQIKTYFKVSNLEYLINKSNTSLGSYLAYTQLN